MSNKKEWWMCIIEKQEIKCYLKGLTKGLCLCERMGLDGKKAGFNKKDMEHGRFGVR
jgi:hypothetical protein